MLTKYLLEIKNRTILVAFAWLMCAIISYCYKETILFLSLKSLLTSSYSDPIYFIATDLTEIMTTYLKLSYLVATQIVFMLCMYHLLIFLSPGLYNFEHKILKNYIFKSFFFWGLGVFFLNKYILNACWFFFLSFQNTNSNKPINLYFEGKINEYVNFYITICILSVVISQIAVIFSIFLNSVENKINFSKSYRKTFYMIFLIAATLMSPPDIYSQMCLLIIFSIIYECLLIITIFTEKKLIRQPIKTN